MTDALRSHLQATRASLIAAVMQIDLAMAEDDAAVEVQGCAHPVERRLDTATMGKAGSFFCQACRTHVPPLEASA